MILIGAFILSVIPGLGFYFRLKRKDPENRAYTACCTRSLKNGMLASLPVACAALLTLIAANMAGLGRCSELLQTAFKDFVIAALNEETFKFLAFRKVLRKADYRNSRYDVIAFMTLVVIGFGLLESAVYLYTSGPGQVLVRGATLMHGGYGFIMGYYYGKSERTGGKGSRALEFLIPLLLHGIYDFTLSPELEELSDLVAFIPVSLALFAFILVFIMIRFFRRARNDERYTAPLGEAEETAL